MPKKNSRGRTERRKMEKVYRKAEKAQLKYNYHHNLNHLQKLMEDGTITVANIGSAPVKEIQKIQSLSGEEREEAMKKRREKVSKIIHPTPEGEKEKEGD